MESEDLMGLTDVLEYIGAQIKNLGNGDATTTMGAIEGLSVKIGEGMGQIANAIESLADANRAIAIAIGSIETGSER